MSLNGIGISLTVITLLIILSFSRGIENRIVARNIRFETGSICIKLKKELMGWKEEKAGSLLYTRLSTLLERDGNVVGVRPRISISNAHLYADQGSQQIRIEGLNKSEMPLLKEMVTLSEDQTDWKKNTDGILISDELSTEIGVGISDPCTIILTSVDGTINMEDFIVTGIFENASPMDKYQLYMEYEAAKTLYNCNLPSRLLIDLSALQMAEPVAEHLRNDPEITDVEIKTFKDFLGRAQSLSQINRNAMSGMAFFLVFISFVGIWAMVTEQVNERSKEIGTLMTFGFQTRLIKRIFMFESMYISLLFFIPGLLAVLLLTAIAYGCDGIYLGRLASFAFGSSTVMPELKGNDILLAATVALIYPLLATWMSLQSINHRTATSLLHSKY